MSTPELAQSRFSATPSPASVVSHTSCARRFSSRPAQAATTAGCRANTSSRAATHRCERLQTDHIDLYQAHRFDVETPLEETLRAFDDLVRQGKVNYIGVSEWTADQLASALRIADEMGLDRIVSNQPQYNMLWRVIEAEVVPLSEREGIGQIVFSPLAQGVLTGKYKPGAAPPAGSRATDTKGGARFVSRLLEDDVLSRVQLLQPLAAQAGLPMSQLALAWVLHNPNVSSAIIGATRPEQITENVAASGVKLDADLLDRIDEVLGPIIERDPAKTSDWRRGRSAGSVSGVRLAGSRLIGP